MIPQRRIVCRYLPLAFLVLAISMIPGCVVVGYIGYLIEGTDKDKKVEVKPEYEGLKDKKTAVIVAADENLYYTYPGAVTAIGRAVSAKLKAEVKGINLTSPNEVDRFQKQNPYWNTLAYHELVEHLNVDRLIFIDVAEYGVHEPGNAEIWRGTIDATISVIDKIHDDPVYSTTIRAVFPSEKEEPFGLTASNDRDVQIGLLNLFAMHVGGLFNEKGAELPR